MLPKVRNKTIEHPQSDISIALKGIVNDANHLLENHTETGGTGDARISYQAPTENFSIRRKKSDASRFLAEIQNSNDNQTPQQNQRISSSVGAGKSFGISSSQTRNSLQHKKTEQSLRQVRNSLN